MKPISRIQSATRREETIQRHAINGDGWPITWASDDRQYASLCDGAGLLDPPKEMYNTRLLVLEGGPQEASFRDLPGYPRLSRPTQKEDDTRYYGFGALALDDCLYHFLSSYDRPLKAGQLHHAGCKLIYSPDRGRTWCNQDGSTPVVWQGWNDRSRETLLFLEEDAQAFSMLSVLQMGRNYEANRDGYIYIYSPNGNTEGTMNELVMLRVRKDRILHRQAYEYFAGLQSNGQPRWTGDILARKPVHTFPSGWVGKLLHPFSWHPSVVYNASLGVYMMANWGTGNASDGWWFGKPSYLGFWIAQHPWGPWTQIHEETAWTPADDVNARCYQPQIAPKWIAPDGKSFWLVWTDYQTVGQGAALTAFEQERKQKADRNVYSETEMIRWVGAMREDMRYYSFNIQRVDLEV